MVIETQASRIADQEATIKELRSMVDELRSLKANLEETLEEFRRQFFGVRSEKTSASKKEEAEKKTVQVKGYTATRKKKATREELYANLPIREVLYTVPEEDRRCDWCNAEMISLNAPAFVREEIRITPAKVERIRYMQEVLICPECKKDNDGSFKKATVPSALIPHSPASASAVAYAMFHKCFMGLPYYRQESLFDQLGAKIPRETLANWCIIASRDYLYPIYEMLHNELLHRDIIHADETVCQVLRENGKTAQSTSYMWIYRSGSDGLPGIVMYEYQPGRSGDYPKHFLEGFHGLLQCDCYQGYNKVEDVLLICCMAHCRRKFYEALPAERKKSIKLLDINSQQEFQRYGLSITRQNMANWCIHLGEEYLSVLYDYLHKELYKYHVIQADETPVLVNHDGRYLAFTIYTCWYRCKRCGLYQVWRYFLI